VLAREPSGAFLGGAITAARGGPPMNIAITFRQMHATDAVKGYATDKVAKLQKFLRQPMKAQVTLSCQNHRMHQVEVDLVSGSNRYHATDTSEDMYASLDKATDKLERQIRSDHVKQKGGERASERLLDGGEAAGED
jgi:putative sigma-54 modulation protein